MSDNPLLLWAVAAVQRLPSLAAAHAMCGVSPSILCRMISGDRVPTVDVLRKIIEGCDGAGYKRLSKLAASRAEALR